MQLFNKRAAPPASDPPSKRVSNKSFARDEYDVVYDENGKELGWTCKTCGADGNNKKKQTFTSTNITHFSAHLLNPKVGLCFALTVVCAACGLLVHCMAPQELFWCAWNAGVWLPPDCQGETELRSQSDCCSPPARPVDATQHAYRWKCHLQ